MKRVLKYLFVSLYVERKWYVFAVSHVLFFGFLYLIVSVFPDALAACVFAYVVFMASLVFSEAIVSAMEKSESVKGFLMADVGCDEINICADDELSRLENRRLTGLSQNLHR